MHDWNEVHESAGHLELISHVKTTPEKYEDFFSRNYVRTTSIRISWEDQEPLFPFVTALTKVRSLS